MPPEKKRPRRHHHLSRDSIARSALELVDREGPAALTMRRLAGGLGVGATNLYTYFEDRDDIARSVVALLLAEVKPPEDPELGWEACARGILDELRAMSLRHPRAFPLVAAATYDESPLADFAYSWTRLVMEHGAPRELYPRLARILDAFLTGFVLLETQEVVAREDAAASARVPKSPVPMPPDITLAPPDEAFHEGCRWIIDGFKAANDLS